MNENGNAPAPDGEAGDRGNRPGEPRRGVFPGFWPWLATTVVLALTAAGLWWHLETREPQIVEVVGPTPPPADPAPELVARAAELARTIALRQDELSGRIAALDPPRCTPPQIPDVALLEKLRQEEADSFARWRRLLIPVAPAAQAMTPAPAGFEPGPSSAPALLRRGPAEEGAGGGAGTAESDPERQSMLAPAPGGPADPTAPLPTDQLRARLESISAIVIGLPSRADAGLVTGSGFFIGPSLLVTNRHVVEDVRPGDLFVTSAPLQRVQPAEIVAITPPGPPGQSDFAVIRLKSGRAPATIPIASTPGKLATVIAAGYPSMSLKVDEGFRDLLQGNLGAAPDLNMNSGEVRSIRSAGKTTQIVHTADVLRGYSGGPLMDGCGRVVGVNTFIQVDAGQAGKLNNAIAAQDLIAFLRQNGISFDAEEGPCRAG